MSARRFAFALFAVLAALPACNDPTNLKAVFAVTEDTVTVYAMSDAALGVPTALRTVTAEPVVLDPATHYDIVFDVDAQRRVVVYPAQLVGPYGHAALQPSGTGFEALSVAPLNGYQDTAAVAVASGQTIVVRATAFACAAEASPFIFSKFVVQQVQPTNLGTAITLRVRTDPDCGFRSFLPGVPNT